MNVDTVGVQSTHLLNCNNINTVYSIQFLSKFPMRIISDLQGD